VSIHLWKLFFDGSACREGQGVGIDLVSPRGAIFEQSVRLEYFCTNNQAEYEAIMLGLQILSSMGVKSVEAFGDSLLVVQQIVGVFQCFNGSINASLDKCLEIIALLMILLCSMFLGMKIHWWMIWRNKHQVSNRIKENSVFWKKNRIFRLAKPDSLVFGWCTVWQSVLPNQVPQNWLFRFLKPEGPEFPGSRMKQAKWRRPILMIRGHPWYVI
jgi:ribonuclease HI